MWLIHEIISNNTTTYNDLLIIQVRKIPPPNETLQTAIRIILGNIKYSKLHKSHKSTSFSEITVNVHALASTQTKVFARYVGF